MTMDQVTESPSDPPPHRFKGYWVVLFMAILIAIAGWIIWQGAPKAS